MIHHYEYINLHLSMFFETKKNTQSVSKQVPEVCEVCAVSDHLRSSHAVMGTRPGLGPGR